MRSQKTAVIEYLFDKHWDHKSQRLKKTTMSQQDVQDAIQDCNKILGRTLSNRNVANFMKDMVRGAKASRNWPEKIKQLRYTAPQRTGGGDVFEFIPYLPKQTEPFPDEHVTPVGGHRHKVQSVSMSIEARKLGRADEAWFIQTAVNLQVIETHLAIYSALPVVQVSHLQMSVKLRKTEIDGLFLARCKDSDGNYYQVLVTCEVKQARERILEDQIIAQVQAAFATTKDDLSIDTVVPIGLRVEKKVGFYLVEFEPIARAKSESLKSLHKVSEMIYEFSPPVPGI